MSFWRQSCYILGVSSRSALAGHQLTLNLDFCGTQISQPIRIFRPQFRRSPGRSMQSHRDWLLAQHGSVCAYCGSETSPETITLDHVRPRRGQTAYDRPDNLVLACRECNAAKADTPLVAFLMQKRARGVFLLHYGDHLSDPLKELARQASERPMLPREA